jgi:hypothetical protein
MSRIKNSNVLSFAFGVLASVLFVAAYAQAQTTISTDIQTDGMLSVTGTSTLLGSVQIGTSTPLTDGSALYVSDTNPTTPIEVHSSYALGLDMYTSAAAAFRAPNINFYKSEGTQFASSAISSSDQLGYITGNGYDSTSYAEGAQIQFQASDVFTPSNHSSVIAFFTVPANSTSPTKAFEMGSNANNGDYSGNLSYLSLNLGSTDELGWAFGLAESSPDIGFSRLSPGVLALGNGTVGDITGKLIAGKAGIGSSTPVANFQVANSNATTTMEIGSAGESKGSCLKLYRTDGSAIYAYVAAGATTFTLTTTACASVSNF